MDSGPKSSQADLAPALDELPLFPLPQTVLFPGALLPLHVFEPRYRTMIQDVLDTHRCLSVVLVTNPKEDPPAIARVAGAGIIVDHTELPGGRYNILVRGRARVVLSELPFVPPYRRAQARVVGGADEDVPAGELAALVSAATAFVAVVRERDASFSGSASAFELRLPSDASAGTIADLSAHHLVLDGKERQAILEELSVRRRVQRVLECLAFQRAALAPSRGDVN